MLEQHTLLEVQLLVLKSYWGDSYLNLHSAWIFKWALSETHTELKVGVWITVNSMFQLLSCTQTSQIDGSCAPVYRRKWWLWALISCKHHATKNVFSQICYIWTITKGLGWFGWKTVLSIKGYVLLNIIKDYLFHLQNGRSFCFIKMVIGAHSNLKAAFSVFAYNILLLPLMHSVPADPSHPLTFLRDKFGPS